MTVGIDLGYIKTVWVVAAPSSARVAGARHWHHIAPTLRSVSHRDLVHDQASMITVSTATIHHSPIRLEIEATLFHTANKAAAWACARQ